MIFISVEEYEHCGGGGYDSAQTSSTSEMDDGVR